MDSFLFHYAGFSVIRLPRTILKARTVAGASDESISGLDRDNQLRNLFTRKNST
jgi:hypothetical protein